MAKGSNMGKGGGASFSFDAKAMNEALVMGCAKATLETLLLVQRDLRLTLSKPGTGKKYSGLRNRSSAPGRPPAAQTGFLRNSWQTGKPSRFASGRRIGWSLGSPVPYARMLEFGTSRIFPRPYLRPALRAIVPLVPKVFNAALSDALKPFNVRLRMP